MKVETRKKVGGFTYSLGSYPVEEFAQQEGYSVTISREAGPFEQRHEFEVAISIEKLVGLLVRLSVLLPEEIYLILETYPRNATQRRICLTDNTVAREKFVQLVTSYAQLWQDEGFIAFGAFSYDPPIELFLNEHKTVVIYTPYGEITEEMLEDFGIPLAGQLDPYYMSVEHVHSSVAEPSDDGSSLPLRERVESELFERFDFYDQTPSPFESDECDCDDEPPGPSLDLAVPYVELSDEGNIMHWRCHVHGRLVVARPGRCRDFDQVFHIAAPDETDAVDWVREVMRDTNARMVRVKELAPIQVDVMDLARSSKDDFEDEGVWLESERLFPDEIS